MDVESVAELMEAVVPLVQALSWPLIVLFILVSFGAPLRKFLEGLEQFTFKADLSGLEASARRQQVEAAALLGAAAADKAEKSASGAAVSGSDGAHDIACAVAQAVRPEIASAVGQATVLWVDDNPANNLYERRALEALGVRFTLSETTEDALEKLRLRGRYDAVVSAMPRLANDEAEYPLLKDQHKAGDTTPLIVYAGASSPEHRAQARRRGAFGSTSRPEELFALVIAAIEHGGGR